MPTNFKPPSGRSVEGDADAAADALRALRFRPFAAGILSLPSTSFTASRLSSLAWLTCLLERESRSAEGEVLLTEKRFAGSCLLPLGLDTAKLPHFWVFFDDSLLYCRSSISAVRLMHSGGVLAAPSLTVCGWG